ncbi:MAG: Eco57I restriction-modification methylase domain-containing protein [Candidatus Kapabacteria bacterium]|nr:Eco57I restriction-modification methylase domain-containing protein [Candidatus Kapabacteria bacterium]
MNRKELKKLIKDYKFLEIFRELGWDYESKFAPLNFCISKDDNEEVFKVKSYNYKRGFRVFLCDSVPDRQVRKKISLLIQNTYLEHFVIFYDTNKQIWLYPKKELNKPTKYFEEEYHAGKEPDAIISKLTNLAFGIDIEENLLPYDVIDTVEKAFSQNAEKITKKFYERFKKEHDIFQNFIQGVSEEVDKDWYSSLMLNRLMFIYFIQKKHFLDNDSNYLNNKLIEVKEKKGKDKFHTFYKSFLIVLFHQGLGAAERTPDLISLLGNIPYLNGGLFEVHQLESKYDKIDIPDEAFEKIFQFFDEYHWHLDTREKSEGNHINPDVIGYIFEKYINDRSSMGAYYTKEDITDYISKNCIIPFLFDETIRNYKASAFNDAFEMLKINPDSYIYDAVKHGIPKLNVSSIPCSISDDDLFADLPDEIKIGFNSELGDKIVDGTGTYLCDLRKAWNKPAPSEIALPTETYRELIERRKRYKEIYEKAKNGKIITINDFITFNLNITQFAFDTIYYNDDPDFLKHFYNAIKNVKILDPTCGSGAFLFAAMNILEYLYKVSIECMKEFAEASDRITAEGKRKIKFYRFREELNEIYNQNHPNTEYFIYKSIILNNLHGVDIMNEAVEIAKLRLFLKLVGTVEADQSKHNLGLEPLPDIDFNIRAGNTLVGFVNIDAVEKAIKEDIANQHKLVFEDEKEIVKDIKEKAELVSMAFTRFKDAQLLTDSPTEHGAKHELEERLNQLNEKLNVFLAKQYGIDSSEKPKDYKKWKESHQPFHWFSEFYEIIAERGGFDVIIGNPPYVEYKDIENYRVFDYETLLCGNLYAFVMERTLKIRNSNSKTSMIIPLSGHSTNRMNKLVEVFYKKENNLWINNLSADTHPSSLFGGVRFRLSIFIGSNSKSIQTFSTNYIKWYAEERDNLFSLLNYQPYKIKSLKIIPKIIEMKHHTILENILNIKSKFSNYYGLKYLTYYNNTPIFWIRAHSFIPYFKSFRDGEKPSTQLKPLTFDNKEMPDAVSCLLSSSLFFIWWISISDCYHLNKDVIDSFPILFTENTLKKLHNISKTLYEDLKKNSVRRVYNYQTSGKVEYDEFYVKKSKSIIDEIDKVLAEHYGFSHEELDFIINYDIKYRMGKELEEENV